MMNRGLMAACVIAILIGAMFRTVPATAQEAGAAEISGKFTIPVPDNSRLQITSPRMEICADIPLGVSVASFRAVAAVSGTCKLSPGDPLGFWLVYPNGGVDLLAPAPGHDPRWTPGAAVSVGLGRVPCLAPCRPPDVSGAPDPSPAPAALAPANMVITGVVPVPAGTDVWVEALDVPPIRGVECARAKSAASTGLAPGSSRFTLVVEESCVRRTSGNLRVCWGAQQCQGVEFEAGRSVDLGVLSPEPPVSSVPNVGAGPAAGPGATAPLARWLFVTGGVALALGGVVLRRRRWT